MEYLGKFSVILSILLLLVMANKSALAVESESSNGLIQRDAMLSKKFPAISALHERAKMGEHQKPSVKDSALEEQYKPWGAASLPQPNQNPGNQVILDKVDDDLFTPNSELHSYDERIHHQP